MREEVPEYDEVQRRIVDCVVLEGAAARVLAPRALDLGIGTGESAARFLEKHPGAQVMGVDASESMLSIARSRLPISTQLYHQDLAAALPDERFDAIISAFAIHHLDPAGKQDLFARVHARLSAGGCFVFGDVVIPRDGTVPRVPIDPEVDLPDTVEDQIEWLRASGFAAKVVWTQRDLAVLAGTKSASAS